MKKLVLLLFVLLTSFNLAISQCNVKTNNRSDGVVVKYFNPEFVGDGNNCELGVSLSSNGKDYFFNTTVLFVGNPKKIIGDLMVELDNEQSLNLELFNSELAQIKKIEASASVFFLSSSDVSKLKNSTIKKIIFKTSDNINQIILLSKNQDIASRQLKCLK